MSPAEGTSYCNATPPKSQNLFRILLFLDWSLGALRLSGIRPPVRMSTLSSNKIGERTYAVGVKEIPEHLAYTRTGVNSVSNTVTRLIEKSFICRSGGSGERTERFRSRYTRRQSPAGAAAVIAHDPREQVLWHRLVRPCTTEAHSSKCVIAIASPPAAPTHAS